MVQWISGWTDIENPYRFPRGSYTAIYISSSWHNILTISRSHWKFTGWAMIEELSIRRWLRIFLISWRLKTCVKHCYVDLSSWDGLRWFVSIWTSFRVFIPQPNNFRDGFLLPWSTPRFFLVEIQHEIILAPIGLCQRKMWKSNVNDIFNIPRWPAAVFRF